MKKFGLSLTIIFMGVLLFGCSINKSPVPEQKQKTQDLYIQYQYSTETRNDIIEIENNTLKFTYVDQQKLGELPMVMEQRPYWTSDDLETIEKKLSDQQINELIFLINDSGFMELKHIEGITDEMQRYYPYFISVRLGDKKHHVEYRSNPEGPPMPQSFKKVSDRLYSLTGK